MLSCITSLSDLLVLSDEHSSCAHIMSVSVSEREIDSKCWARADGSAISSRCQMDFMFGAHINEQTNKTFKKLLVPFLGHTNPQSTA